LTDDEVVARIAADPSIDSIVQGEAGLARAAAIEATRLPNLELGYSREQVFGDADAADDYLTVTQTLPLSGARGLRRRAGEIRAKAAEHSGQLTRAQLVGRARLLFYETLLAQRRAEAVESWIERLSKAHSIVDARERSGDAAAYERARLERELTSARARIAFEEASGRRLRGVLAGLLRLDDQGFTTTGRVDGSLLPQGAQPTVEALLAQLEQRPDVLGLDEHINAARLDERAAKRGWVPSLTVEGGWRSASQDDQRAHGYVASVALTLPFLDHDQGALRRASAEQRVAAGQRDLIFAQARGVVVGLHAESLSLSELARRFREESEAARQGLLRSVEAAYRGDEATLLELLDVQRSVLDDELQVLELEMSARRARIDIDLALGRVRP
jgi:outer membrane protein TolC